VQRVKPPVVEDAADSERDPDQADSSHALTTPELPA
jgi:hypothetical protein